MGLEAIFCRKYIFSFTVWLILWCSGSLAAQHLMVQFSEEAGFYTSSVLLQMSTTPPQATIYYTTDGSVPDINSMVYEQPIELTSRVGTPNDISMIPTNPMGPGHPYRENWQPPNGEVFKIHVIRAISVLPNGQSGPVSSASYLIDPDQGKYSMPIVSIMCDRDSLFGFERGIYVPGITGGNYFQRGRDWERPVHIEFFEQDGTRKLSQHAGVRIHGGTSRNRPRKTLRFYARSEYGNSWFDHALFPDKPVARYKRFLLRNSGNDWSESLFRDAYIQHLIKGSSNIDIQYSRASIVFINGEYWGIHNIRDRYDDRYLEAHYGLDPDRITVLENQGALADGNPAGRADYESMFQFITNSDMSQPDQYHQATLQMDMNNFMDYNLIHIFSRNTDWPGNNINFWKYLDGQSTAVTYSPDDGRWRWMVLDTDFGLGLQFDYVFNSGQLFGGNNGAHNTLAFALADEGPAWPNPPWSTALFRSLMNNHTFRSDFINRYADLLNTCFSRRYALGLLDSLIEVYQPELGEHIDRWREPSIQHWQTDVQRIRDFVTIRTTAQRGRLNNIFSLGGIAPLTVDVNDPIAGFVQVNTINLKKSTPGIYDPVYPWEGTYFNNHPVRLIAHAEAGYTFSHWSGDEDSTNDTIWIFPEAVNQVIAHFTQGVEFEGDSMNPAPFPIFESDYTFEAWPSDRLEGEFPPYMIFQQSSVNDPVLTAVMTHPYHIPYNGPEDNDYHANDQDKIGFPYNLTGRTRIDGLGDDGIAFINTGRSRDLGAAVLALDTREVDHVLIDWTASTLEANSRVYHIRLQYRTGLTDTWRDVTDETGNVVEYRRDNNLGEQTFTGISFPADAVGLPYVQLRWKYYYTGTRLSQDSGARDKLRLDDIKIYKTTATATKEQGEHTLTITGIYPNPAQKEIYIQIQSLHTGQADIQLINVLGQNAHPYKEYFSPSSKKLLRLDISHLRPGLYICKIIIDGKVATGKVIISEK
jgi:hypothetical protein